MIYKLLLFNSEDKLPIQIMDLPPYVKITSITMKLQTGAKVNIEEIFDETTISEDKVLFSKIRRNGIIEHKGNSERTRAKSAMFNNCLRSEIMVPDLEKPVGLRIFRSGAIQVIIFGTYDSDLLCDRLSDYFGIPKPVIVFKKYNLFLKLQRLPYEIWNRLQYTSSHLSLSTNDLRAVIFRGAVVINMVDSEKVGQVWNKLCELIDMYQLNDYIISEEDESLEIEEFDYSKFVVQI